MGSDRGYPAPRRARAVTSVLKASQDAGSLRPSRQRYDRLEGETQRRRRADGDPGTQGETWRQAGAEGREMEAGEREKEEKEEKWIEWVGE